MLQLHGIKDLCTVSKSALAVFERTAPCCRSLPAAPLHPGRRMPLVTTHPSHEKCRTDQWHRSQQVMIDLAPQWPLAHALMHVYLLCVHRLLHMMSTRHKLRSHHQQQVGDVMHHSPASPPSTMIISQRPHRQDHAFGWLRGPGMHVRMTPPQKRGHENVQHRLQSAVCRHP